ncbi:N-acetylmuramoyl-L-alanine amidase [Agrobacterium sp. RC10-4-1]|uniref:N-acetylmuramoyl-L-alanine amidase n=2 Tax=Rhizobium/Agrobacterium group TaxID=227290 RepID=UPI000876D1D8|nr:N-acetylmuramoyl-L-alanine amidase [Agrobacterium sp. RC10-4-1]MDP9775929.1 LysM repeat protein [Rhizobium sp. SORGH_AS_0755]SCY05142.1 LysM domain-containing protein [Rhizobium sp. NFACC06-2]
MSMKSRTRTDYIAVHCAATRPSQDIGRADIDRWHRAKGWLMIGYHFVIRRDGRVETGRPVDAIGAHVEGYNSVSVGICLAGGVDEHGRSQDNFTPAQYAALAELLIELKAKYPKATIQGHRDFPKVAKDCPCFDVRSWVNQTGVFLTKEPVVNPKPVEGTPKKAPKDNGWAYHTIVEGDTLFALGRKYGVSVDQITALNPGIRVKSLKIGQTVRVR